MLWEFFILLITSVILTKQQQPLSQPQAPATQSLPALSAASPNFLSQPATSPQPPRQSSQSISQPHAPAIQSVPALSATSPNFLSQPTPSTQYPTQSPQSISEPSQPPQPQAPATQSLPALSEASPNFSSQTATSPQAPTQSEPSSQSPQSISQPPQPPQLPQLPQPQAPATQSLPALSAPSPNILSQPTSSPQSPTQSQPSSQTSQSISQPSLLQAPVTNPQNQPTTLNSNNNINNSSTITPTIISNTPTQPVRSQSSTSSVQFIKPKSKFKCLNNTDCLNGVCDQTLAICYCRPGYTGESCAVEIDECRQVHEPCLNNGTCIDSVNHYTCECQPGFKGDLCQDTIDMCETSPCLNAGKCINHRTSYSCLCEHGWEGKHCELNIDECQPNPCLHNGTCEDLINGYKCDCGQSGFVGKNCETDFDDCDSHPCSIGAKECIDLIGDFKCVCHEGFEGKRCEEDIDECLVHRCENNGTCVQNSIHLHNLSGNSSSIADLTTSYHDIRDIIPSSLGNINISHFAGFMCECKPEFYGDRCEEKKKCYTNTVAELCNNPIAECINQGSSYDCLINTSFDGSGRNYATYRVNGQFKVHEIYVKYRSLTGGVIMSFETTQPGSPIADLQLNKSGLYLSGGPINRNVDIKFDEFLDGNEREIRLALDTRTEIRSVTLSRQNDVLSDFQHIPFKGCLMQVRLNNILVPFLEYGGPNHTMFNLTENQLELGPCKTCFEKDCQHGGHCDGQDGYERCVCLPTFTGTFCETDVNECHKINCLNGGACENFHGGFQCKCKDGYKGETCQEISDYCKAKQPCVTGTCRNVNSAQGLYQCECPSTHIGKKCERKRDCKNECHSHQAQCINNVTCACLPGKKEERTMCELISKCEQIEGELCRNGGLCRNSELGGYYCDCQEPFYGHICEYIVEKSPYDVFLLIGIACIGFLVAAVVVVGLVIFRSVRKARATRGTYSPSTQEKFGNSACDLLKPPQPERLI